MNGIRIDNRISNLRDVPRGENAKNKAIYKNNRSGVSGVGWESTSRKWKVTIAKRLVGRYKCKLDAIAAVLRARKEHGYHKNHGRV